jgi:hypothetical protein
MQNKMFSEQKKECIASIAMFRELVNHGLGVYDILAEFLKYTIYTQNAQTFTALEINNLLKKLFYFSVPDVIIKVSLKKIKEIEEKSGKYVLTSKIDYNEAFLNTKFKFEKETENVFNAIINFIENKQKRKLSEYDRNTVFY